MSGNETVFFLSDYAANLWVVDGRWSFEIVSPDGVVVHARDGYPSRDLALFDAETAARIDRDTGDRRRANAQPSLLRDVPTAGEA